jgi:hypothetical protein
MKRHGPDRSELIFRLVFSLVGLVVLAGAVAIRGIPTGPALVEVFGIAGLFFGGTALWTVWKLTKGDKDGL